MKTVATFGFLLPQKGVLELVEIVQKLHEKGTPVRLLLLTSIHPAPVSAQLESLLRKKIETSGIRDYITLDTGYLDEKEIVRRLSQADKILFFYTQTQESSSAAVRMGLLSGREVITTPLSIFDDVKTVVTQTKETTQESMVEAVTEALARPYDNSRQTAWCRENSWQTISRRLYHILQG